MSTWFTPDRRVLLGRLRVPFILLVITHVVGIGGYLWEWRDLDASPLDAWFMTFITITTIGFSEIHPLSPSGRVLTMLVAGMGIGSLFHSFTVLLDYAASEGARSVRRRRKMQKQIDAMSGHFILAGLGRVGREAAAELKESGVPFVVVDPGPTTDPFCTALGCPFIKGDASEDTVLVAAGVKRAKGLITTTSSDATNLFVILSARLLNAEIFIASRAVDEASIHKLIRAGANRAISPYAIGGRRLAHVMLSPRVVDFLETALTTGNKALNINDVVVSATGAGKVLESLQIPVRSGATLLAVVRQGTPIASPPGSFALATGDHLLLLGTSDQLNAVEGLLR